MKPINCAFHPKQQIVNFCRNQSCLLPMCPNCVKVHSKQHCNENTFGEFVNIHEVYDEVQINLQNVLKALVNFNEDLKEVFCEKQSRRQAIKKRMGQYRVKVMTSIQRYIDQLQTQILNSMGGQESNVEDDFNQINEKIEAISKNVEKQFRTLNGEKTLKGIITHFTNNMADFYDQKLDQIEIQIGDLQSKDVSMCKQFRLNQLEPIHQKIHQVYKSIFVGTIKPVTFKGRQSRISKCSRSRVSTTK